jgi:hypothetical protein
MGVQHDVEAAHFNCSVPIVDLEERAAFGSLPKQLTETVEFVECGASLGRCHLDDKEVLVQESI